MIYSAKLSCLIICLLFTFSHCKDTNRQLSLKTGQTSITIDPNLGGRITSLQYRNIEILNTKRDSAHLQWGSTLWTSPQSDWNWPPPAWIDSEPYMILSQNKKAIVLASSMDPIRQLLCTKKIEVVGLDSLKLTYSIINKGETTQKLALWENSRIPYKGTAIWEEAPYLWELGPEEQAVSSTSKLYFKNHTKAKKAFIDSEGGYLIYETDSIRWTKQFDKIQPKDIAPKQKAIEIYYDPLNEFAELEVQGKYQTLSPQDTMDLQVLWTLSSNNSNR